MYSITRTITLESPRVRVRLHYNVLARISTITLECNHDYFHEYLINVYYVSTAKLTSMATLCVICF